MAREVAVWAGRGTGSPSSRWRLATGLVLFAYATTHLLNHALGLISLEAMEQGRHLFVAFWRNGLVELVLLAAFLVHAGLGVARLWRRPTWRMPPWEAAQLGLGLLIPVLGTLHVLATAYLHRAHGVDDSYVFVLLGLWPDLAWRQTFFTLAVWIHGCIGLHFWLRLRPGYRRVAPWLFLAAVLVPVLALIGFVDGARQVIARAALDPAWLPALAQTQAWPGREVADRVYALERQLVGGFLLLLGGVVAADLARAVLTRRRNRVRIAYDGGRSISVPKGVSLLDASRMHGIPHASVCGGRGRCSTCRVRVTQGLDAQPAPAAAEQKVLERLGAAADVRLACQLRPSHDLAVTLLMPAQTSTGDVMRRMDPNQGTEREVAVLFSDLRDFTRLAERRLPYDVVYVLNRYFAAMGHAIQASGGHVDKFIGDGIMALFGLEVGPEEAARQALAAAASMAEALDALNRELAHELKEPLRMGIGLHAGPAIVGELGFGRAASLTAIGDTVNTASRLEAMCKELGCQLVVSEHLVQLAGVGIDCNRRVEVEVRGREDRLPVLALARAAEARPPGATDGSGARGWRRWLARGAAAAR
jgi:adenylate cyclase